MPSSSEELRREWANLYGDITDKVASRYLHKKGWILTKDWTWVLPEHYRPTEQDLRAVQYLFEEWDYGGIDPKLNPWLKD
jgi:hypothetical protein